jgi:hypothetical protein
MLAHPQQSRVILFNPLGGRKDRPMDGQTEFDDGAFPILAGGLQIFEIGAIVVGEPRHLVNELGNMAVAIDGDGFSVWKNDHFMSALGAVGANVLFIGGQCLEEEILISAMQTAILGYDVRVLVDLSRAKRESERKPALDRLSQYGVLQSTVRQMLLEWAVALDNPAVSDRIRILLSQAGASAQA